MGTGVVIRTTKHNTHAQTAGAALAVVCKLRTDFSVRVTCAHFSRRDIIRFALEGCMGG